MKCDSDVHAFMSTREGSRCDCGAMIIYNGASIPVAWLPRSTTLEERVSELESWVAEQKRKEPDGK